MDASIVVPEEVLLSAVRQELPRDNRSGLTVAHAVAGIANSLSEETRKTLIGYIWEELPYKTEQAHYQAWKAALDTLARVGQEDA